MPPANLLKQWMWTGASLLWLTALVTKPVYALTAHQTCQQSSLCTIGEFVYSDAAVPITDATCQFTSFDPSGQSFVNAASITGTADGWYGYSFTPDQNTTLGTYPTQLCCQTSENNLCIDKTFEVTAAPDPGLTSQDVSNAVWNATISGSTNPDSFGGKVNELQNNTLSANDIWSYSGRTLSNFGTLVTDVWGSANRTLTGFGSLVGDVTNSVWNANPSDFTDPDSIAQKINTTTNLSAEQVWDYSDRQLTNTDNVATSVWDYQNRSLTSFGNLVSSVWSADSRTATDPSGATAASITELQRQIQATQTMIEQLSTGSLTINQISLSDTPDFAALLDAKLATTKDYLSQISNNLEIVSTRLGLLAIKWDQLSDSDRTQELQQILTILGTTDSTNMDTLIGQLGWFAANWPKTSTVALYQNVTNLRTDINDFITAIQAAPDSDSQLATINQLFATSQSLKADVGDISQAETSPSLYGHYKTNRALTETLANQLRIVTNALNEWDHLSLADRDSLVNTVAKDVGLINRFSALKVLLSPVTSTPSYLLNVKAVITANQAALAAASDPVIVNWIGPDATNFYTFTFNPSKTKAQVAQVSYYLPSEFTTEQLTNTPSIFTAVFNPEHNAIAVTGSINLDPDGSALHTLTTTNIWGINQTDLDNLRSQTNALTATLEKSPLYPQAMAIQQNILKALDTIQQLQLQTPTPEAKIQAFRQIQTLKQSIDQGLNQLQDLANSQQNSTSLMGFVGGVQAVAVWGMIIIVIAGFVFLSLYMRALYQQLGYQTQPEATLSLPLSGPRLLPAAASPTTSPFSGLPPIHLPFSFNLDSLTQKRFAVSFVILSALLLTIVSLRYPTPRPSNPAVLAPLEPSPTPIISPTPTPTPTPVPAAQPSPTPAASDSASLLLISPPTLDGSVNVRRLPNTQSAILTTITTEENATEATHSGNWVQVTLTDRDPAITGWLNRNAAIVLPQ